MKAEGRILPLNMLLRVAVSHFPCERGDDCPPCDLRERNPSRHHLPVRGWGSARTLPEERGPIEAQLRRKAETDRVREGISEGCRSVEPDRVAPGGARAVEPQPRTFTLPFRHALCKDYLCDSTDRHRPPLQPREIAYATES
jgi:hypothetical protein